MARKLIILILVTAVLWIAVDMLVRQQQRASAPAPAPAAPPEQQLQLEPIVPPPSESQPNRVADIRVSTVEELDVLFDRVENMLDRPRSEGEEPLITLVLHGSEVEFFALKNYEKYKGIVDRAAKLAALGAVDISICQTQMRNLGMDADDVPSFLRQVPYGPGEVERLIESGYVYM